MDNLKPGTKTEAAERHVRHLVKDIAIILFSVLIAFILVKTGAIPELLASVKGFGVWGTIVVGVFFTSIFTTAPAIVALAAIAAETGAPLQTALFGAIGAVIGDIFIFRFVRDSIAEDFMYILKQGPKERLQHFFKLKFFRWTLFMIGGLIIASPLPDELGIMLMGITKIKTLAFIPISFVFNFLGILFISLVAS